MRTHLHTLAISMALLVAFSSGAAGKGQDPPANISPPTMSGSPLIGSSLSGATGTWSGVNNKYSVQWGRCDSTGANCEPIEAATGSHYTPTSADAGGTIRFVVTAANKRGSATAASDATAIETVVAPTPSSSPTPGTAPTVPPPVDVVVTEATATTLSVAWSQPLQGAPAKGYEIYVNGRLAGATAKTTFSVGGLSCSTTYEIAVSALDSAGVASDPTTGSGRTAACADTKPPTSPGSLSVSARTATTVTLTWSPSTDDVGVAGYGVYSGAAVVATTTTTSHAVSGLTCGATYSLAVDAFDAAGNRSPRVAITTATAACPTSSSSTSIYWGAWIEGKDTYSHRYGGTWANAPWDSATWDRFEHNAGKKVSILHYGQPPPWEQSFLAGPADLVTSRGAIPLMDMSSKSVPLRDIANGAYDSSLATWANAVKRWGKPIFLRWNWEMNGTWFPWGAQAKQDPVSFVAAWRRFHDIVTRAGASNVTWVWCPNLAFSGSTPFEQLYPGDAYVDWTCLDGYNKGTTSTSFSALYKASYDQLLRLAPDKPIMIGEIGSEEYASGVKAQWITDALRTQLPTHFPRVKALVWFNWRIYENNRWWNWDIESSSTAQSAFARAIASPYYAKGGVFGQLPLLTKIKPLP